MCGRARSSAGLTLIELMVVIAVMAILATTAAPAFQDLLAARRLSGDASLLMTDLQHARSEAVRLRDDVEVTFSATGYTLRIPSSDTPLRAVTLSSGTSITAGSNAVIRYDGRRGMATTTNADTVKLEHSAHSLQIQVTLMGRIQCTVLSGTARC